MDADATARGGGVVVVVEEEDYSNQKQSTMEAERDCATLAKETSFADKQEEQTAVETATKG
jgi:hypothetical protein